MRYLSVCSGIEAASVAWHPLGWQAVAFSEIEPFPRAVLAHHYPTVPNWGDLTRFKDWPDATFDVLVGGTPCQSFSVAGLRKGLDDPRGNLALTYLAVLDRYRPTWCCWENVPGVLSSSGGRDFGAFVGGLGQLGYGWAYRVLDAQFFGVAQRRRRVFVVGCLGGWQRAAAVLFDGACLQGHPSPREQTRQEVAGSLGAGAKRSGGRVGRREAAAGHLIPSTGEISHCLNAGGMGRIDYETETLLAHTLSANSGGNQVEQNYVAHALRADGFDASEDGTGRGTPLVPIAFQSNASFCGEAASDLCPTMQTQKAGGGGMPAVAFDWQSGGDARGLDPKATAQLQRSQVPATMSGMAVRRLTPRECERLQGFPDDYTLIPYRGKPAADGPRYKALGNSMAVPVMAWIGRRLQFVHQMAKEKVA